MRDARFLDDALTTFEIHLAGLGEFDLAGRAVQQP
jgi:hypothetical protein